MVTLYRYMQNKCTCMQYSYAFCVSACVCICTCVYRYACMRVGVDEMQVCVYEYM